MKKNLLIISVIVALSVSVFGQSQRMVLFEEFTSASCSWCAYFNPNFNALLNANSTKCTAIKYQSNFGYDPMYLHNTLDVNNRTSYYAVPGYPDAVMDGNVFHDSPGSVTQTMINTEYAVPSPFELTINQQLSAGGDSIYVIMLAKATAAVSGSIVAHCAVIEKHIHFNTAPGTNGEKDFYNVMKKMLPSASGSALPTSIQPGDYFVYKFAWKLANVYTNSELSVIGFIQNTQTKEVYQSANTTATPITGIFQNDLTVLNPGNLLPSYCEPSVEPTFEIQNNGSQPLTSAEIKYKINDGSEASYLWSGNLGFLQKAVVSLPSTAYTVLPSNILKIYGVKTNGGSDEYPKNDTLAYNFTAAPTVGNQVKLYIRTDNKPEETTWNIKDIQGNVLASGGPYAEASHGYSYTLNLAAATCYEFNIYDSGNNGICCDNGTGGFFKLYYNTSTTICTGTSFGSSMVSQFYSFANVGVGDLSDATAFSVFPNPTSQKTTVSFTNMAKEQVSIQVYNMQGAIVYSLPVKEYLNGQHDVEVDCSKFAAGVYSIRLTAGSKVFSKKLTVN